MMPSTLSGSYLKKKKKLFPLSISRIYKRLSRLIHQFYSMTTLFLVEFTKSKAGKSLRQKGFLGLEQFGNINIIEEQKQ